MTDRARYYSVTPSGFNLWWGGHCTGVSLRCTPACILESPSGTPTFIPFKPYYPSPLYEDDMRTGNFVRQAHDKYVGIYSYRKKSILVHNNF